MRTAKLLFAMRPKICARQRLKRTAIIIFPVVGPTRRSKPQVFFLPSPSPASRTSPAAPAPPLQLASPLTLASSATVSRSAWVRCPPPPLCYRSPRPGATPMRTTLRPSAGCSPICAPASPRCHPSRPRPARGCSYASCLYLRRRGLEPAPAHGHRHLR
jgi:hypothetical protein